MSKNTRAGLGPEVWACGVERQASRSELRPVWGTKAESCDNPLHAKGCAGWRTVPALGCDSTCDKQHPCLRGQDQHCALDGFHTQGAKSKDTLVCGHGTSGCLPAEPGGCGDTREAGPAVAQKSSGPGRCRGAVAPWEQMQQSEFRACASLEQAQKTGLGKGTVLGPQARCATQSPWATGTPGLCHSELPRGSTLC